MKLASLMEWKIVLAIHVTKQQTERNWKASRFLFVFIGARCFPRKMSLIDYGYEMYNDVCMCGAYTYLAWWK